MELIPEGEPVTKDEVSSRRTRASRWKRVLLIAGGVIVVIALVAGTWVLATVFQSPEQREANASAPPPQPVFAAVTTGTLADVHSYSGTVAHGDESGFTLPAGADAVRSVVTGKAASVGSTVRSGDVLTEVNTRPVFLVTSPFDFFRDMGFGDEGADVRVLQEALVSGGYLARADGEYGAQTARAVTSWYRDAGYEAPTRQRPDSDVSTGTGATSSDSAGSSDSSDPSGSSDSSGSDDGGTSVPLPEPVFDAFVPIGEVLAVPILPATIITGPAVGAHVGEEDTDVTLGTDDLIVRAEVVATDAEGLAPGDAVTVLSGSDQADGILASIEAQPADDDGNPQRSILIVSFDAVPAVLASERGETVTIQVQDAVVAGEFLIVPTAAVVGRGEGRGVVVKRQDDGSLAEVLVTVEGSLRGMTAVAPDEADALVEGDDVRVG